jgi:hypothetical protein
LLEELIPRDVRAGLIRGGALPEGASADELRQMLMRMNADFRDKRRLARPLRRPSSSTGCDPGGLADARRRGRQDGRRSGAREA